MPITRFFAAKFKEEYAGDDENSKKVREELFQKHLTLYNSRPYVSNVQAVHGKQTSPMTQGYHYAIVTEFESEEKVAYYTFEDQEHLDFKADAKPYLENTFVWSFPPRD